MGSKRKKRRDRLSKLPDNILHQVLSFLDLKSSIQTSLISKRWRNLWTSLPYLDFNSRSFARLSFFATFVLAVLDRRDNDSMLARLSFCCRRGKVYGYLTNKVISYAISHSVNHLSIGFRNHKDSYRLPPELLMCQSLKTLALDRVYSLLPESLKLTTITSLTLSDCYVSSENGPCFDPFATCLNLRNLTLIGCKFGGFKIVKISGPQLVNLTMTCYRHSAEDCKVEIFAPKLTSFGFESYYLKNVSLIHSHLPCLEHAEVDVQVFVFSDIRKEEICFILLKFLEGLNNAQYLSLGPSLTEALINVCDVLDHQLSRFTRLKCLKLQGSGRGRTLMIPEKLMRYFLNGSTCMQSILVGIPKVSKRD